MKRSVLLGGVAVGAAFVSLPAATTNAAPLVTDSFDVTSPSEDVNHQIDTRQTGPLAPLTYTEAGPTYQHQVGNIPGQLLLADGGSVSPDHNFTEAPGLGEYFYVSALIDPVHTSSQPGEAQSSWTSITLGTTAAERNQFVNASDGFGILFRGDGRYQAFNDNNGDGGGEALGEGTYTTDPATASHPVEIRVSDAADGNPFDGTGDALVQVFADNGATPVFTFTRTGGFTSNFLTLQGNSDNGVTTTHAIDNLSIGTSVVPEPASAALLAVGGLGLLARRRRQQ